MRESILFLVTMIEAIITVAYLYNADSIKNKYLRVGIAALIVIIVFITMLIAVRIL